MTVEPSPDVFWAIVAEGSAHASARIAVRVVSQCKIRSACIIFLFRCGARRGGQSDGNWSIVPVIDLNAAWLLQSVKILRRALVSESGSCCGFLETAPPRGPSLSNPLPTTSLGATGCAHLLDFPNRSIEGRQMGALDPSVCLHIAVIEQLFLVSAVYGELIDGRSR